MSYQSFLITQDQLDKYYTPKKDAYNLITQSIISNGYGQEIYDFKSTNDNSLNSLNIYNTDSQVMKIYIPSTNTWYSEEEAGPLLWGVTSQQGLDFLNGVYNIPGLLKLKYCNSCSDRNGLPLLTITSFTQRFTYVKEIMTSFGSTQSYLFYDFALPNRQNFFPAVMDPNIGNYIFKNYQGINKTELQVAAETGIPRESISTSLSEAVPILPSKTFNYILTWCCDFNISIVIESSVEITFPYISFRSKTTGEYPPCWSVKPTDSPATEKVDSVTEYKFCEDCQRDYGNCKGGSGSSGGGR